MPQKKLVVALCSVPCAWTFVPSEKVQAIEETTTSPIFGSIALLGLSRCCQKCTFGLHPQDFLDRRPEAFFIVSFFFCC